MLRIGVIGAGSIGSQHLRVYGDLASQCELVAVAEMDLEKRKLVGRRKDWKVYSDYHQMAKEAELDAVSVALPNELHAKAAIECLRNGIDVLVEKPMALSLADARKMIEVAKRENRILMVGHVERFNPAVQFIHKYIADGRLGELHYLSSRPSFIEAVTSTSSSTRRRPSRCFHGRLRNNQPPRFLKCCRRWFDNSPNRVSRFTLERLEPLPSSSRGPIW